MKNKNIAFTLTEILIALTVVGAIAALAIPGMLEGINNKINSAQLKSAVADIQQLIDDQLTHNKAQTVESTDLNSDTAVFSDFETIIKCPSSDTSKCWADEVNTGSESAPSMMAYKVLNSMSKPTLSKPNYNSAILKNGVSVAYNIINESGSQACYGEFWIDINGKDKPNILGRDLFNLFVTKRGQIVDRFKCDELKEVEEDPEEEEETPEEEEAFATLEDKLTKKCKDGSVPSACLTLVELKNWKIDF